VRGGDVSKRDTANPCLLCGWAEHMGCHTFPRVEGRPETLINHKYVPWSIVRNRHDKPADDAPLFDRAAWWLSDYAEFWDCLGTAGEHGEEGFEGGKRCLELLAVAQELRTLG